LFAPGLRAELIRLYHGIEAAEEVQVSRNIPPALSDIPRFAICISQRSPSLPDYLYGRRKKIFIDRTWHSSARDWRLAFEN
jgi:hypothetical protein